MAQINDFDPERIQVWEQERHPVINFGFLSEANTYAYRDAKVSLATVRRPPVRRDARPGPRLAGGHRPRRAGVHHPPRHPARRERPTGATTAEPGYWTGEASMPRSAQFERTAVHLYLPAGTSRLDPLRVGGVRLPALHPRLRPPGPLRRGACRTATGRWPRKAGAYIALWSWRAPALRTYDPAVHATRGMVQPFDLVAEGGPDNVWIVEVGTSDDDGDLEAFVDVARRVRARGRAGRRGLRRDVDVAVGRRRSSSRTTGPFVVDGDEQPLGGFARHESPWGTVEHLATRYALDAGTSTWAVDADGWTREVS